MDLVVWGSGLIESLGYIGVFVAVFINNILIGTPTPDAPLVILAGGFLNPFLVAIFAASASTLGETVAYGAGLGGKRFIKGNRKASLERIQKKLEKHHYWLPILAIVPTPSTILGISSGVLGINSSFFIGSVFMGRFLKMMVYASIGFYGLSLII